jgi:hypothetical protein
VKSFVGVDVVPRERPPHHQMPVVVVLDEPHLGRPRRGSAGAIARLAESLGGTVDSLEAHQRELGAHVAPTVPDTSRSFSIASP